MTVHYHHVLHGCGGATAYTFKHNLIRDSLFDTLVEGLAGSGAIVLKEPDLRPRAQLFGGPAPGAPAVGAPGYNVRADLLVSVPAAADVLALDIVIASAPSSKRQSATTNGSVGCDEAGARKDTHYRKHFRDITRIVPLAVDPAGFLNRRSLDALTAIAKLAGPGSNEHAEQGKRSMTLMRSMLTRISVGLWRGYGHDAGRMGDTLRLHEHFGFKFVVPSKVPGSKGSLVPAPGQGAGAVAGVLRMPGDAASMAAIAG
jgi:hypothetical protein